MKKSRRALSVVLLAVFLDLISNGILIPIVPQLLANPDSPYYLLPAAVPVTYAYIMLGFLIAAVPIFLFFSSPILGELSDRYGRRKIMTWALSLTGVSFAIFAVGINSKSLTLLFAARILAGIAGGNVSVAQAAIADITPPRDRAKNFGLIGAAYGVGFIIGPVLGGLLSDSGLVHWFNAATPFWFAMILSFVNAILVFAFLGETRERAGELIISWKLAVGHIIKAYALKPLRAIFGVNFLFQAGITLFATFFSVFLITRFGFSQVEVGYYIGYAGVWLIFSQAVVLRMVAKRFDEVSILRFFLLAGAISIGAYYIPEHTVSLLVVGAFFAVTNGVAMAALPALASQRASARVQGEVLGINGSVQALAQAVPPILAGFLAAKITPAAPIYAAGIVIALAWVCFMIFVKR